MKKFLLPITIIIIIVALLIVLKMVNLGALTISIIEKTAHVDIESVNIQGNIFQGYRIEGYNVKLSETDSIYGEIADIRYRFKPFVFRLPSLFQINLIEPTVCITEKMGEQKKTEFTLLRFNLGLRINLKNGKVIYKNDKTQTIEKISGLVLIDFVGDKIFLNTVNLSLKVQHYPIHITSANLNIGVDNEMVEIKSFAIKGKGIVLNGEGTYSLKDRHAALKFKRANINLETAGIHTGKVNFFGEIEYKDGNILPKIQGTTEGVHPFDRFKFETTSSFDTIWMNIFDGEIFDGSLFASIEIMDLKNFTFETNFKHVNVAEAINSDLPIFINGYIGYKGEKFIGFLNSPREQGFDIDSLFVFGSATKSQIILDSLFVKEGEKTLGIKGKIYSGCDLKIVFNNFDLERFSKYVPLKGTLKGECYLQGSFKNPTGIIFTSNLTGSDFLIDDVIVENFTIQSQQFKLNNPSEHLKFTLGNTSFKNWNLQKIIISINDNKFSIEAEKQANALVIKGTLDKIWQGVISSLSIEYNGVETKNITPISFDILAKKFGEIYLSFIGGTIKGTISPLKWNLSHGSLKKLGKLLGFRDSLGGELQVIVEDNKFSINAQDINFRGLKDGSLKILGDFKNKAIKIDTLAISDASNQRLYAGGFLSFEESNIRAKFTDVGVWALPFLQNFMSELDGLLSGEGVLQGTLDSFTLNGKGEIKNASFVIDVISAQFDSVVSKVTVDNNMIIFESGKGIVSTVHHNKLTKSTNRARVTAGGVVKIEPRFGVENLNFDFSFKDAPIQFQPFVFGIGSGNFSVGMKEKIMYYNGNLTVKEGVVPIDFGLKTKQEEGEDNWTMNLKIKGDRNIWLRNRDADIEFGGEVYIIKEHTPLHLSGTLETRRGNYYWLNHILSITSGEITFIPEEEIDPELDIWAEMDTREGIKIILHLFGPMSEPIFEFFSDPPIYSEQDIVTYLNLNITWQELESIKSGEYVGKILTKSLLLWLESDVSRRIRQYTGLDYFIIEGPFFDSEEGTKLTVGKYISKDLFITYTYGITTFSNEFNVEYFIDDKNEILIRRDEEGEYSLQYQYRIRF